MRTDRQPFQRALCRGAILGFALLVTRPVIATAGASAPALKLVQERSAAGGLSRVRVLVVSPRPLGAYTLQLTFDPDAAELIGVAGGSAEFASPPLSNPEKFPAGTVRFSAFQGGRLDGPKGRVHVATLTFQPRASKHRAHIQVQAITVADTGGKTYSVTTRRKTVRLWTR